MKYNILLCTFENFFTSHYILDWTLFYQSEMAHCTLVTYPVILTCYSILYNTAYLGLYHGDGRIHPSSTDIDHLPTWLALAILLGIMWLLHCGSQLLACMCLVYMFDINGYVWGALITAKLLVILVF